MLISVFHYFELPPFFAIIFQTFSPFRLLIFSLRLLMLFRY